VHGAAWSRVVPAPVAAPRLVAHAREVAGLVGFTPDDVAAPLFAEVFGGNALLPGMEPYAANYGGHQFGAWAGQLGDGRAITLGEVVNAAGERWELQLKGAGRTPYSRSADGRAVLRSSIREFLCSEAMHHLGVPTTRALSLVATGEQVMRDMFYDGRPRLEPGAIVCRVAPSFIRFGTFELPASRGDRALLDRLIGFTIERDFPELAPDSDTARAEFFAQVCERTAHLVAHWMRVGFVHGVMNTDNMSILGLTIDYGPYGWIDDFDPGWTPNTTDAGGRRYAFGRQPAIAYWNLERLAAALAPAFPSTDPLSDGLRRYVSEFNRMSQVHTAAKLGLLEWRDTDEPLADALFDLLQAGEVDMTRFFRLLADVDPAAPSPAVLEGAFYDGAKFASHESVLAAWLDRYAERVRHDGSLDTRRDRMHAANPQYVLRNYLAQETIDRAEQGDSSGIAELLDVLRAPYDERPGLERFAALRPSWARDRPGCSMLSCSS
jgi:uncharacterized protein YdiU (UPF0061 family)